MNNRILDTLKSKLPAELFMNFPQLSGHVQDISYGDLPRPIVSTWDPT